MNSRTTPVVNSFHLFVWSLPSLVSVLLFACLFPLGRTFPIWRYTPIAEVAFYWFLTITPITIIVAMVRVLRFSRKKQLQHSLKITVWGLIVLTILLNGVVVIGLLTAFTY